MLLKGLKPGKSVYEALLSPLLREGSEVLGN